MESALLCSDPAPNRSAPNRSALALSALALSAPACRPVAPVPASPYDSAAPTDGGADSGGTSGDGGAPDTACTQDDDLVASASLRHVDLDDQRGDRQGAAWFTLVSVEGLTGGFEGTARICRELADETQACTDAVEASGAALSLPSTLITAGSHFHVEVDDGATARCSPSVVADLDPLDFDAAGMQRSEELAWTAPTDLDVPPTLVGVAIHGGTEAGVTTMTIVSSVSSAEGLQQTALVHFDTGRSDAVQPTPDGGGFYLLSNDGVLRLRLTADAAVLEEWDMIPVEQRCIDDGALRSHRSGDAPADAGACAMLSHGMIVDPTRASATVLSRTPGRCPDAPSEPCMFHDISTLGDGALDPVWTYDDHVEEIGDRKLDHDLPYINGLGLDGDITCASWFSVDFDADTSIPAVICIGVAAERTVFDLDASVTHIPHDADPLTLADGSHVLMIADNTNGDVDSNGDRRPPRIQLYTLPTDEAAPPAQLEALASFDTGIQVADNYRFGSVAPRVNAEGGLVTVYVDGSGVHELGVIDPDATSYTALARQALSLPGGSLDNDADLGARKLGAFALERSPWRE